MQRCGADLKIIAKFASDVRIAVMAALIKMLEIYE